MDINRVVELLRGLPFRQAVWLFPLATALHFLEEAPHFADWASKYALSGYTDQRWRRIHGLGTVFAIAFCGLASMFPNRAVVFLFFALCFSESVLNSMFHMGATAFSGVYCPGLITALILYPIGRGLSEIRHSSLPARTLLLGVPFTYVWLLVEVGLVEEFFFRCLLQSRSSTLLRSQAGGTVLASLLFGLAHAPGLYLRPGGTQEAVGAHPSWLMAVCYSIVITSVAGVFLGVLWARTRNLILVMAVHAAGDWLPNLVPTIKNWL
jgi:membrane protease YdiL (CAAX protease family)